MKKRTLLGAIVACLSLGLPAVAQDKTKVGFVYVGPINDGGWTQAHHHSANT